MPHAKFGRLIAAVIVLVGVGLLIAALLTPWYSFEVSLLGQSGTAHYYTGLPTENGTIQYSCSYNPGVRGQCGPQTSYSSAHLNNTGVLAETAFFLLIGGVVLGVIAALLGLTSRRKPKRASPAIAFAVIALILAIAGPVVFASALPNAFSKDDLLGHPAAAGPWSTFSGSNSSSLGNTTLTWGPGLGWYLSIGAFVLLLVGGILLLLYRKDPPTPATSPS